MPTERRLLIGSCGGLTGVYLAKRLTLDPALTLVGADCNSDSIGFRFVREHVALPKASDSAFIERLCEVVKQNDIDLYLPTHSAEMRAVAWSESEIRRVCPNLAFMVSPVDSFVALDDKAVLSQSLATVNVPTPAEIKGLLLEGEYPIFMKRRVGSGGAGSGLISSRNAHLSAIQDYPDAVFFEYIAGPELTIDCMFDDSGVLLGYNQRRRVKTLGGAAIVAENDWSVDVGEFIRVIAAHWKLCGCVNFQCIVQDGIPYFTDANLRYPSGGLPLSVESGLDVPSITVALLRGEAIDPSQVEVNRVRRRMYRYFEELFEVIG